MPTQHPGRANGAARVCRKCACVSDAPGARASRPYCGVAKAVQPPALDGLVGGGAGACPARRTVIARTHASGLEAPGGGPRCGARQHAGAQGGSLAPEDG